MTNNLYPMTVPAGLVRVGDLIVRGHGERALPVVEIHDYSKGEPGVIRFDTDSAPYYCGSLAELDIIRPIEGDSCPRDLCRIPRWITCRRCRHLPSCHEGAMTQPELFDAELDAERDYDRDRAHEDPQNDDVAHPAWT